MDKFEEKFIKSTKIYDGCVFNVTKDDVVLSNGISRFREVVHHNGGVVIVAEHNNKIIFVRQYRYPTQEVLIELPAGKLDKKDETPIDAAKRELKEETGFVASTWKELGFIWPTPGFCTEKLHLFKAENLIQQTPNPEEGEIISFAELDKDEVFSMIKDGRISDSKTICAITRAFLL